MLRKTIIGLLLASALAWTFYALLGSRMAALAAARFGARLLAMAAGKFTNAERFVHLRLRDAALLLSAACLLGLFHLTLSGLMKRTAGSNRRWILEALSLLVCLNLFVWIAAQTVLFWCLLFTGTGHTHNYTQYQIKQGLMSEVEAPSQAVLLGSSQTRAEIDEGLLNERLGQTIWTTELHFPGSRPYDMILSLERLPAVKVDYIICYLSEGYFYTGVESDGMMLFFGFRDLPEYFKLASGHPQFSSKILSGLLGDLVPLFRYREPLAGRLFGFRTVNIAQERYDTGLNADLAARAKVAAAAYRLGPAADFQKRAFSAFAQKCRQHHCKLIICCGQMNPILQNVLNPALRADMLAFLRQQAARDANILLLEPSALPPQTTNDYDDLTHVNELAQARFSQYIANVLQDLVSHRPSLQQARND